MCKSQAAPPPRIFFDKPAMLVDQGCFSACELADADVVLRAAERALLK